MALQICALFIKNGKGDVVKLGFTTSPLPFTVKSEPEISSVILFDQSQIFKYNSPRLFIRHVKHFFLDQFVTDCFCLR